MPEKHTTHDLRLKRGHQRRCYVCICKYISKYQNLHTTWQREINLNNSHCKIGYVIGYFEIRILRKLKQCGFFWYTKMQIQKYINRKWPDNKEFYVWRLCFVCSSLKQMLVFGRKVMTFDEDFSHENNSLSAFNTSRLLCHAYYPKEIAQSCLLTHFVEQKVFTNLTLVFEN